MSSVDRARVAQAEPSAGLDLSGFPSVTASAGDALYRAQGAGYDSAEYYASSAGRFDLESPRGTWYLARDLESAIFEYLGLDGYAMRVVPRGTADQFEVWMFDAVEREQLADIKHRSAASYGVTSELGVMTPYAIPRRWADAFDAAGFDGIQYESRFTPSGVALAVFGDVGSETCPSGVRIEGYEACQSAGIAVVEIPTIGELEVVSPPSEEGVEPAHSEDASG